MQKTTILVLACLLATGAHAALVISDAPTSHMNCSAGLCVNDNANAVLNAQDLRTMLHDGDVTVQAGSSAEDIQVQAQLHWAQATRLTLDAERSIAIAAPVSALGTGAVTLTTHSGGYSFSGEGKLNFWDTAGSLTINGNPYALEPDIASLASAIASNPSGFYALSLRTDASLDGTYAAPPIPTSFGGTLEGLGHAIANLKIDLPQGAGGAGLFADIGASGKVIDLVLDRPMLRNRAKNAQVGALAATNEGLISSSTVLKPNISGEGRNSGYGGMVGLNSGVMFQTSVLDGHVTAHHHAQVGGLTGGNLGFISRAFASDNVVSDFAAGGLVGFNFQRINLSHAKGDVTAGDAVSDDAFAGGLAAWNDADLIEDFATGAVQAGSGSGAHHAFAGGLVGRHIGETISQVYARGHVSVGDNAYAGGLAGENDGDITSAYCIGAMTGGSGTVLGGVIGQQVDPGDPVATYWDMTTSGISNPAQGAGNVANQPGITGLTTAQFKSGLPSGFNNQVWGENSHFNGGYPYLLALPPG